MKKFALLSDAIFFTLCAFVISFTAIRFYFKNALTALILAIGLSLAVGTLCLFAMLSGRKKRIALSLGEAEKKSLSLHLSVSGATYIKNLFKSVLDGTYAVGNHLEDSENSYFFNFKMSPLTADDIADVLKKRTDKPQRLYCCSASADALSLAEDFSLTIVTIGEIYALLKEKKLLPESYAFGGAKKAGLIKRIRRRFNRRLCPSLFFSGITLLFFSFFSTFSIYYIVIGGLLTLLSALCLFFGQSSFR